MAEPLVATQMVISAISDLLFASAVGAFACAAMLRRQGRILPAALGRFRLGAISILAIAGGLYLWVKSAVVSDVPLTEGGAAIMTVLTQSHFGSAWTFGLIGVMFASLAGTRQTRTALWLGTAGAVVYAAGKAAMTHAADAGDLSLTVNAGQCIGAHLAACWVTWSMSNEPLIYRASANVLPTARA
jgi:copper resistance protein D